ncbi:PREDICTED: sulfotransferase 1C2-like [Branchiostoma belcheri]|uniref:Sulfotransferase n=1 Tax=Branchiostoma belcheri TaxID=7741 RepID=A0A6P4Y5Z2_BRABE|nr:PREDICTED: sulfotransferase 1C2-like [Branchiostoma belcheri]
MSLSSPPLCPPFYYKGVRFMPFADRRAVELVESFEVRKDDVFVSAYQKSGKAQIIYCARNVKDVIVSFHNMRAAAEGLPTGTFDENFQEFINPEQAYFGFWWDVVPEYWRHKDDDNLLFIKYEDMKRDLRGHVVKIANFLGKTLSDQRIDEVVANCTFSAMKENPATNVTKNPIFKQRGAKDFEFMRKGEVGDWKNWLSPEQNETLDAIYREKMKGVDLTFEFE